MQIEVCIHLLAGDVDAATQAYLMLQLGTKTWHDNVAHSISVISKGTEIQINNTAQKATQREEGSFRRRADEHLLAVKRLISAQAP